MSLGLMQGALSGYDKRGGAAAIVTNLDNFNRVASGTAPNRLGVASGGFTWTGIAGDLATNGTRTTGQGNVKYNTAATQLSVSAPPATYSFDILSDLVGTGYLAVWTVFGDGAEHGFGFGLNTNGTIDFFDRSVNVGGYQFIGTTSGSISANVAANIKFIFTNHGGGGIDYDVQKDGLSIGGQAIGRAFSGSTWIQMAVDSTATGTSFDNYSLTSP